MEPPPPPEPQLPHAQSVPSFFDDSFRDVPRGHHHRRSHRHKCNCKKSRRRHSHHHHRSRSRCRGKNCDCSDAGSSEFSVGLSESTDSRCHHHKRSKYSDDESDESSHHCKHRSRSERRGPRQVKREDREREFRHSSTQAEPIEDQAQTFTGNPAQGITIPQHIVIPPTEDNDGNPRKYHVSYTFKYPCHFQLGFSDKLRNYNILRPPTAGNRISQTRNPSEWSHGQDPATRIYHLQRLKSRSQLD